MKLSIIIPVYNAEQYFQKCLESVFNQDLSLQNYEVICINDGSTDASLSILNKFQEEKTNLKVISTENKGPAHARNIGLEIAKGEYITFVDADDYIVIDSLRKVLDYIDRNSLDILYANILWQDNDGIIYEDNNIIGKDNVISDGLIHQRRTLPPTFYKRELIGKMIFPTKVMIGEDTIFNALVQLKAKKVSFFSEPYYVYVNTPNSLSKKIFTDKAYIGFLEAVKQLISFKEHEIDPTCLLEKKYIDSVILIFLNRIIDFHILPNFDDKKYVSLMNEIKKDNKHLLNEINIKYPYFGNNFFSFKYYQKWLKLKSKFYNFLFK